MKLRYLLAFSAIAQLCTLSTIARRFGWEMAHAPVSFNMRNVAALARLLHKAVMVSS